MIVCRLFYSNDKVPLVCVCVWQLLAQQLQLLGSVNVRKNNTNYFIDVHSVIALSAIL
jgi:hypothetical protein